MTCSTRSSRATSSRAWSRPSWSRARHPRGRRRRRRPNGGPCRVQAPSGAGGHQDHAAGLRPRPPDADHHQACVAAPHVIRRALGIAAAAPLMARRRGHRVRPRAPAKPPDPPAGAGQASFGRTPAGDTHACMVTFADRPDRDQAGRASRGLGDDCGRWCPRPASGALAPASPATARDRALRRPAGHGRGVVARPHARATGRPPPPAPGPAPAFTDPLFIAADPVGPARRPDLGRPTSPRPARGRGSPSSTAASTRPTRSGRPRQPAGGAAQHPPRRHGRLRPTATPATAPTSPASPPRPPTAWASWASPPASGRRPR